MKKLGYFFILLPLTILGQVFDDFSDGDFTQNPAWLGDTGHFRISSSTAIPEAQRPAVQLNAPAGGQSFLALASNLSGNLEWQFWIKLSLNTSAGNFARVYLLSDNTDLKMPLHGYYLQFGGIDDSVGFYRMDSVQMTLLARMQTLFTGNSTNAIRMKVTRSEWGDWDFFGDPAGTNLLLPVGESSDYNYPSGSFFGIYLEYTGSNTTKFYFDDVYAGQLMVDTLPPSVASVSALTPDEIELVFNEAVSLESAEQESNYMLNNAIGSPYAAVRLLEPEHVMLFFEKGLENGKPYTLEITDISDLNGNVAFHLASDVMYYRASPYDIIFTEIMADPLPSAGLPEFEFLEILNRSDVDINLDGWHLVISSTFHEFPQITIHSGEYLILCSQAGAESFQPFGRAIGFGSFVLPNSGTSLQVMDSDTGNICYLDYDLSWYKDDYKSEGGYSLEMTDPGHPCLGAENWSASGNPGGGTPGKANFNSGNILSDIKIAGICCVSDMIIDILQNASIDSITAADTSKYLIEPGMGHPVAATALPPEFCIVRLTLPFPGVEGQIYHLSMGPGMKDCIGDDISYDLQADFAWPEPCSAFDIVINEILFNPLGDGVDYVELYNRSGKAVLLNELSIASVRETPPNPPDTQIMAITGSCISLMPDKYLLLTRDPEMVRSQYFSTDPGAFLEMASFPSFNNDEGFVLLLGNDGEVIDGFHYNDEMHFLMLNTTEGVSLERICPDRLGDDPGNWHSAAETAGFGTPGCQNSQYLVQNNDQNEFSLEPELFSPDGDGIDDQLGIFYRFEEPGKLVSVLVFSVYGRLAKTLVNNEMPGTSGIFSWDGTLDDRTMAEDGIYIVYMEALGMDGRTSRFKKACVLARRR